MGNKTTQDQAPGFFWLIHGKPDGFQTNATDFDPVTYKYFVNKCKTMPQITRCDRSWFYDELPDGSSAFTITKGGGRRSFRDLNGKPGSYAGITVFLPEEVIILENEKFAAYMQNWLDTEILRNFTIHKRDGGLQWRPEMTQELFTSQYDGHMGEKLHDYVNTFLVRQRPKIRAIELNVAEKLVQERIKQLEILLVKKRAQLLTLQKNTKTEI